MGHLGEAVPVLLVLSEPHTLGAGVSTVCGVAIHANRQRALAAREEEMEERGEEESARPSDRDARVECLAFIPTPFG